MANDDCQVRLKKAIKEKLDELEFVKRKETYSETLQTLIAFYNNHKKEFEKWWKKQ
jgi:hypothetical protein